MHFASNTLVLMTEIVNFVLHVGQFIVTYTSTVDSAAANVSGIFSSTWFKLARLAYVCIVFSLWPYKIEAFGLTHDMTESLIFKSVPDI